MNETIDMRSEDDVKEPFDINQHNLNMMINCAPLTKQQQLIVQSYFDFGIQDSELCPQNIDKKDDIQLKNEDCSFIETLCNKSTLQKSQQQCSYLGQREEEIYQKIKAFKEVPLNTEITNSPCSNQIFPSFNPNNERDMIELFPRQFAPKLEYFDEQDEQNEIEAIIPNDQWQTNSYSNSTSTIRVKQEKSHSESLGFEDYLNNEQYYQNHMNDDNHYGYTQYHSLQQEPKKKLVFQIIKKDKQIDRQKKDYDKNICRYITRQVVRSFASIEFKSKVLNIISQLFPESDSDLVFFMYNEVKEYFLGIIENLSGFRALKQILVIDDESDGKVLQNFKRIFKLFMKWYLKERYFRFIINGNMNDKLAFIKYKNQIMLHYIDQPQKWNSNKKQIQKQEKLQTLQAIFSSSAVWNTSPFISKQEFQ